MTFKLLLARLVVIVIVSLLFSAPSAQCTDPSEALAQLQDAQLRPTLKSYEAILGRLQEAPQDASVSAQDGKQVGVANLISLAQVNLNKCTEDHFRLLVDLRKNFAQMPLATYIKNVITQQRRFCEQYLDEQADSKVAAFSGPTRKDFELFLEHDKIGHDFYVSPEVSIVKLRAILELAGDEQQQARALARGQYVASCREITSQLEHLVPIRRDHDIFARLPMSCDRYFRAYEFCRNLVDFNYSSELAKTLFLDVQSRTEISRLGGHLNALGGAVVDRRQRALEAARALVREQSPIKGRQSVAALASASERAARVFNRLKAACASGLDLTENLRWLREHATAPLAAHYDAHLTPRAVDYLRALEGCSQLVELQVDEVLQQTAPANQQDQVRSGRRSLRVVLKKLFNASGN